MNQGRVVEQPLQGKDFEVKYMNGKDVNQVNCEHAVLGAGRAGKYSFEI